MVVKRLILVSLLFLSFGCKANEIQKKTDFELFKGSTFSASIAHGDEEGDIYEDALASLKGFRARAKVSLDAYAEVNNAIEGLLAKPYQSKKGGKVELFACMDLMLSEELESIFLRHDPCDDPSNWREKSEFTVRCSDS